VAGGERFWQSPTAPDRLKIINHGDNRRKTSLPHVIDPPITTGACRGLEHGEVPLRRRLRAGGPAEPNEEACAEHEAAVQT
jgi:hypothetical protein